ncbi:MAG: hypothetical protein IPO35_13335 [Uliginosibacterium sp.]|nr:hypothetical protein [Uliginosibacterium sp.]
MNNLTLALPPLRSDSLLDLLRGRIPSLHDSLRTVMVYVYWVIWLVADRSMPQRQYPCGFRACHAWDPGRTGSTVASGRGSRRGGVLASPLLHRRAQLGRATCMAENAHGRRIFKGRCSGA